MITGSVKPQSENRSVTRGHSIKPPYKNPTLSPRGKNSSLKSGNHHVKTCINTQNNTPFSNCRKASSKYIKDSSGGRSIMKIDNSNKKPKFLEKFNKDVVVKKNSQ